MRIDAIPRRSPRVRGPGEACRFRAAHFGGLVYRVQQLRLLDGLRDEVVGTFLDGFHCDFYRSVSCNQNHFNLLIGCLGALQKFDAIHHRQTEIRNEDVDAVLQEDVEGLLAVVGFQRLVSAAIKHFQHGGAPFGIVINNKDCG